MRKYICTLLLISNFAWAVESINLKSSQGSYVLQIERGERGVEKGLDKIRIFDSKTMGKPLVQYESEDNSFFEKAEIKTLAKKGKVLIVTYWNHGARSKALKIFDPQKPSKPIFEDTSISDIALKTSGSKFYIEGWEYTSDTDPTLKPTKREWSP